MTNLKTHIRAHSLLASALLWGALSALWGCSSDAPPTAAAIHQRDSLPVMTTLGVSKLISDSGVIRYKVIAERWDIYDQTKPPRQEFPHGIFLQQFDEKFHVSLYLTADTAYCYNQTLWKLRGRVFARNAKGATFSSEELYWDMVKRIHAHAQEQRQQASGQRRRHGTERHRAHASGPDEAPQHERTLTLRHRLRDNRHTGTPTPASQKGLWQRKKHFLEKKREVSCLFTIFVGLLLLQIKKNNYKK